jgi:hypothetical protein
VRLPAGHGERHASSPELLVDGEERKSGSTAASLRRGGATVAGGGPATVRRKRRVSSSSTGEERRGEALGRRSPDEARDGESGGNGDGEGSDSGAWHLRTGVCGHGWSGRRRRTRGSGRAERASAARLSAARREVCCRDAAPSRQRFNPRGRRGAWRPRGSGALPRGPSAVRDG